MTLDGEEFALDHGDVVIAAITSCTNTSNPSVMLAAGLLARNALEKGLETQAVGQDLAGAGLEGRHRVPRQGRAAPIRSSSWASTSSATAARRASATPARCRDEISAAVNEHDLAVVSVLSGNRNFEGRINPDVKMNYLASPPLVVAYALAGTMDVDPLNEPFPGTDGDRSPTSGRPSTRVHRTIESAVQSDMFRRSYGRVFEGDERWAVAGRSRRATRSPGTTTRPTCATRRTSRASSASRRR